MNDIVCLHPLPDIIPLYLFYISICFFVLRFIISLTRRKRNSFVLPVRIFQKQSPPSAALKQFEKMRQENPAALSFIISYKQPVKNLVLSLFPFF